MIADALANVDDLLLRIARCPVVADARATVGHACHVVVNTQPVGPEAFHLPEPWNGDLRFAPLLFVSSNPSIGPSEDYPTTGCDDDLIEDCGLAVDGMYGELGRFWKEVRAPHPA
ncbi:MAG: hypothetical protein WA208_02125 [Thermoanaerobaculia bacterium]